MDANVLLTESELIDKKMDRTTLAIAKHMFDVQGYLKIENLFTRAFVEKLANALLANLRFDQEAMTLSPGTQVAHRRYIVNVPFTSPFNDAALYANSILLCLMREFLGPNFVMSSLGCVVSLPGATDQHIHADYYPLFEEAPLLIGMHPPFAITVAIPLVDIDPLNGPTKIWPGSHRTPPIEQKMHSYAKHLLHGPLGSCYFWDYRTYHAGGSNHTEEMRPLLYFSYTRRWFRDTLNPDRLILAMKERETIPEEHRKLFF